MWSDYALLIVSILLAAYVLSAGRLGMRTTAVLSVYGAAFMIVASRMLTTSFGFIGFVADPYLLSGLGIVCLAVAIKLRGERDEQRVFIFAPMGIGFPVSSFLLFAGEAKVSYVVYSGTVCLSLAAIVITSIYPTRRA
jgi:hypothetical protein